MKKTFILTVIFLFAFVYAHSVKSDNPDYYYIPATWWAPNQIAAQDSASGDWHYFEFPPNTGTNLTFIKNAKKAGLGVEIDYYVDHLGKRKILSVSLF